IVLGRMSGVASSRFPRELKDRAVSMVRDLEKELGGRRGAVAQVAAQLGVNPETLRAWVRRAPDAGRASGVSTGSLSVVDPVAVRMAELEQENAELRRANEILKAASAFFAREMDHRPPR
ncbi:transposase, partial [Amycolatopsis sp. NPDC059027]|uniref:transposase n=1 Tax=Amycolatopsis sp. NPDC059027 TaxID=3346709 RepID=UPI0036724B70